MKAYQPSGHSESGAPIVLLLAGLAAGAAAGAIAHYVGNWFRLLILFPLGMGLAVGMASGVLVTSRKVRAPILAAALAFAGGAVAWLTDHGLGYGETRESLEQAVGDLATEAGLTGEAAPSSEAVDRAIDQALIALGRGEEIDSLAVLATLQGEAIELEDGKRLDPAPEAAAGEAFYGWLANSARQGTTIKRGGSGGIELGETGTWILWLIEILIAGGVAAGAAHASASEPFCESCGLWYRKEADVIPVGGLDVEKEVLAALDMDDLSRVAAVMNAAPPADNFLALTFRGCPQCSAAPRFTQLLRVKTKRKKVEQATLRKGLVEADLFESFAAMAKGKAAEASGETQQSA